ncbi:YceD family protein [Novosphingobium aquimarinum]|uniref:YceD family protein n=1 Tax=Novosphingobium aquimarinum TaxID=2682494 RepID=UPI0012EC8FEA|nr:YceD family protein [Novosphingobium aquimarinum]
MTSSEFSHSFDVRQIDGREVRLVADEAERAALARRFDIVRVDRLEAVVLLRRKGRDVAANGTLDADVVQSCAISSEDLPVSIHEEIALRFVPAADPADLPEELELEAEDLDEIEYDGSHFDLGEAVAQTLGLAIDPYLTGPDAEEARRQAGLTTPEDNSPFAVLKGLGQGSRK